MSLTSTPRPFPPLAPLLLAIVTLGWTGTSLHAAPCPSTTMNSGAANADCGSARSTPVASLPFNPLVLSELSPPVIEPKGSWLAHLETADLGPGVAYLIGSRRPGLMPTRGGMFLVELAEAKVLQTVQFSRNQDVVFHLPIPEDERLCSQRMRVQAVIVTSAGTHLSNAFDLTLGR